MPVYDATGYMQLDEDDPSTAKLNSLNLLQLGDCPLWQGEIPERSFVSVLYTISLYKNSVLSFNIMSAVILGHA